MTGLYRAKVWELATVTGTGSITLSGVVQTGGFQTFSQAFTATTQTSYGINDKTATAWESGIGTYNTGTNVLTRTQVLESSNAGSLVNFAGNTCDVTVEIPSPTLVSSGSGSNYKVVALNSIGSIDPSMAPIYTSPTFSYSASGQLMSISYADGTSKAFTYTNGLLTQLVFTRPGNTTITKVFNYTGQLLSSVYVTVI